MRGLRGSATAFFALGAALAAGCGGGERQDADEPRGNWTVDVVQASFPTEQRLAEQVALRLRVRNADSKPIPNLAVTVDGFSRRSEQAGLADPSRPVWVIDDGPRGGTTAYTNTWALGRVKAGEVKEFVWHVTPVKAGRFEVKYRVAAGLDGRAKAVLAGGRRPAGSFAVAVSRKPDDARVDPDTGQVVRD
ncbi:MAG TPA: hypothetical protein VGW75_04470 [Solirubrobacteraceae bacterium]|jgi:hypothetical protein|nr:hypothetical protein [Solirubrobacteraceae bacterium]